MVYTIDCNTLLHTPQLTRNAKIGLKSWGYVYLSSKNLQVIQKTVK